MVPVAADTGTGSETVHVAAIAAYVSRRLSCRSSSSIEAITSYSMRPKFAYG